MKNPTSVFTVRGLASSHARIGFVLEAGHHQLLFILSMGIKAFSLHVFIIPTNIPLSLFSITHKMFRSVALKMMT